MRNLYDSKVAQDRRPEKNGIQVIERAADILRTVAQHPRGLSLGEIALQVGLARSTVQRIVDALAKESLLMGASASNGVKLGPALITLGAATHFPITDLVRPTLEALAKRTGETVDLSLATRDHMTFLDQVPGTHRLAAVSSVGVAFPMHCSANGKAAVALMSESELKRVRKTLGLARQTANTITDWESFNSELALVRQTGVAYDREETSVGICAIAKAFRSHAGDLVAISIPVPTMRFKANETNLANVLELEFKVLLKKLR
jgi:DNA-binding IclR family transcriptional regulator